MIKEFDEIYEDKHETWKDAFDGMSFESYDEVWIFGAPLSSGSLTRYHYTAYNKYYETNKGMNFITFTSKLFIMYLAAKLGENCPIREVSFDPMEASMTFFDKAKDVTVYHGYNIDHLDMKRIDTYQAQFERQEKHNSVKKFDFVFGYTYMSKERDDIHLKIQKLFTNIESEKKELYVKNKFTGVSNELKYEDYIRRISQSRFTLVVPAYQPKCFSCYRFIESVYNNCLPLVHESCFTDEFFKSYNIDEIISRHIIVNENNINEFLTMDEEIRLSLLETLRLKLFTNPKELATLSYKPVKQGLEQFL